MRALLLPISMIVVLIMVLCAYLPGLTGPFVFDDIPNITSNNEIHLSELTLSSLLNAGRSGASGTFGRPISMISFALNNYFSGLDPYFFKITNLVIHVCCGMMIFILTSQLLNRVQGYSLQSMRWISLTITALWMLHPLNLTTVLYVVQRMTSLSAFFTLLALIAYMSGRVDIDGGRKRGYWKILASLVPVLFAVLSKENGALAPLMMLLLELFFFSFKCPTKEANRLLMGFYCLTIGLPAALIAYELIQHSAVLFAGYANRGFTLSERVLTEGRVLWFYIRQILVPDVSAMGLYLDDFKISHNVLTPITTLAALIGLILLAIVVIAVRKSAPILAFGISFFFVGHLMESTVYPLDIAFEHRNYLPMYGILLNTGYYLLKPYSGGQYLRLQVLGTMFLILLFSSATYSRAIQWSNPLDLFTAEYRHHPESVRNNIELGTLYSKIKTADPVSATINYAYAHEYFSNAAKLDLNDVGGLLGIVEMNSAVAEPDSSDVNELAKRLQFAPFAPISADKLLNLSNCKLSGKCKLSNESYMKLISSVLNNPTLVGSARTKVLYAKSTYEINIEHNYEAAISTMREMINATPDEIAPRMALVNFLVALGRNVDARGELSILRQMRLYGSYVDEVEQLERQLN